METRYELLGEKVISELLNDYVPFIESVGFIGGQEMFRINAGSYSCLCGLAGAVEFDNALRKAAEEYGR